LWLGADECETAARIFKCGVDKDAVGMANLIETSSANAAKQVIFCYMNKLSVNPSFLILTVKSYRRLHVCYVRSN